MSQLYGYASQEQTPFTGVTPRYGLPFDFSSITGGQGGMLIGMLFQSLLTNMMGQYGMVPGQFQPTMSMMDRVIGQEFITQRQQMAVRGAMHDQVTERQMAIGGAQLAGVPVGPQQRQAIASITGAIQAAAPFLSVAAPNFWDEIHGIRGSANVLGQGIQAGGRYAIDPITGATGFSPETNIAVRDAMFGNLYGPGANIGAMRGFRAGQVGQLYDEMTRRGMLPSVRPEEQVAALSSGGFRTSRGQNIDELVQQAGGDINKVIDNPEVAAQMRAFTASQAADKVKNMTGAMAAMREIFGDAGHPNAPMPTLINAINALSQGQMANMSEADLTTLVRRTQVIARQAGMQVDAITSFMTQGAQLGASMGLTTLSGAMAGQRGALFGQAWAQLAGPQGFGGLNAQQASMLGTEMAVATAASPDANRLGAIVSLGRQGFIRRGSLGEQVYQAIQGGDVDRQFRLGNRTFRINDLDTATYQQLMREAGVANPTAQLMDRTANQQMIEETGIGQSLQRGYSESPGIRSFALNALGGGMSGVFQERFGAAGGRRIAGQLSDVVRTASYEMPANLRAGATDADRAGRNNFLAQRMYNAMTPGQRSQLGRNVNEQMAILRQGASAGVAQLDAAIRMDPKAQKFQNYASFFSMTDRRIAEQAQRQMGEVDFESQLRDATAGLFQQGPLSRLADALTESDGDMGKALSRILGGESADKINTALAPVMTNLMELRQGATKDTAALARATPAERRRILEQRQQKLDRIRELVGGNQADLEQFLKYGPLRDAGIEDKAGLVRAAVTNPDKLRKIGIDPKAVMAAAGAMEIADVAGLGPDKQKILEREVQTNAVKEGVRLSDAERKSLITGKTTVAELKALHSKEGIKELTEDEKSKAMIDIINADKTKDAEKTQEQRTGQQEMVLTGTLVIEDGKGTLRNATIKGTPSDPDW